MPISAYAESCAVFIANKFTVFSIAQKIFCKSQDRAYTAFNSIALFPDFIKAQRILHDDLIPKLFSINTFRFYEFFQKFKLCG